MSDTNTLTVVPTELEKAVEETHLSPEGANSLKAAFAPHFIKFHELALAAKAIPESSPKAARAMRLEIRAVRIAAETTRKELGEDALRRKKAIDGVNNLLLYALKPVEEHLDKIERAEEIRELARLAELKEGREKALAAVGFDWSHFRLEAMPDAMFDKLLSDAKAAHEAKLEAQRKAEEERQARELAERTERERLRIENDRLKREAAERDRVILAERERIAKEQAAAAEALRQERAKLAAERAEIEAREAAEQEAQEKALNHKIEKEALHFAVGMLDGEATDIEVGMTTSGRVIMTMVEGHRIRLDLDRARRVRDRLSECIERLERDAKQPGTTP